MQQRRAAKLAKATNAAVTFEAVAREFHEDKRDGWSATHVAQWLRCVEKDLFPFLGALPLADISAPVLLAALTKVEKRGALRMAHDLREFAGQVFRYGVQTGRCMNNPAADLRGALKPYVEKNMAAVLEPVQAGALLRAIDGYGGQPTTRAALLLSALLFQRPGNIREMEWAEIDAEAAMWTIPSAKMKRKVAQKINGRPQSLRAARPLRGW